MKRVVVRAPATTANLGPGFDCAAAALDLWNEVVVEERSGAGALVHVEGESADEVPRDAHHLALRAFALLAPVESYRFRFVNRIPFERGLGSSAAAVAAGLVAAAAVAEKTRSRDELVALGTDLEGHADNLAAAVHGGVCLTWRNGNGRRVARVATDLPLTPVVVVPEDRVGTSASRDRLPPVVEHADAAAAAAQAALLGAAIAAADPSLLADAMHDRLHEPYREADAPLLAEVRRDLPSGAAGVTLSGSGPSVVVWAEKNRADEVAAALRQRLPETRVLLLRVAPEGAEAK
jgi:homoserine kinase